MPSHYSFTNAPPPPQAALQQYLVQTLGPAAAAQILGRAGGPEGLMAQMAAVEALKQSVTAGQPPAAKHPTPNLGVPKPAVDTSGRESLLGAADLLANLGGGAAESAAPTGGWTPAAAPDSAPSNFLADLFGGQDASANLLQFGLRMMAGSEPQPGATRGPGLLGAIGEAGVGTLAAAQHRRVQEAEQEQARRKEQARLAEQSARVNLTGGYEEASGINWQTGRANLSPEERQALFMQAYPRQGGTQMAAEIFGSDPPGGYRSAEGGLEFIPGGPADPEQARLLAEAKRAPGGADPRPDLRAPRTLGSDCRSDARLSRRGQVAAVPLSRWLPVARSVDARFG